VVQIGRGGIPRLGFLLDAASLSGTLRGLKPDVIYQRVACAYTGICAAFARRHAIPMVWHVAHDTDVAPRSLDPGRNILRVRLEKWAANHGARHATRIVVQTHHQAALLRQNFNRTADAVIPNFHPPAAETLDKSGAPTVVWIANLKAWKRPEVFVRLAAKLSSCRGVKFVMVGLPAGAGRFQDTLMAGIAAQPNLEYLGSKTHAEVNALLARASIFVNTSTQEGFPNTFIQAWLRDVAVVSLSVDPDHVLEKKQVGILAQSESGLADAVRRLIEDPKCREAYAARGRAHAVAQHSLRNTQELIDLIDRQDLSAA
jgi:glycosyltransferase involved in cell wall biosynthesis